MVENAMQDVRVYDIRSSDHNVIARFRRSRGDEPSGVGVVGPEEPFRMLGNDLNNQVRTWLINADLEGVGAHQ